MLVRGFDYAVLFRVTSGRPDITVVAVMHTRRSVSRWRLREKNRVRGQGRKAREGLKEFQRVVVTPLFPKSLVTQ